MSSFNSYKDYFYGRTAADVMQEHSQHYDEWATLTPKTKRFCIKHNDYDIACKIFFGNKIDGVIIGVHGFAGDKESSVLRALADNLCKRNYALLCFDFPAHGLSTAPDNMLSVQNCQRDLMTVADYVLSNFQGKKYGIFATSFGGYITLLCAQKLKNFKKVLRAPAVTMAESFIEKIVPITKEEFLQNGGAECGFERKMFVSANFYTELVQNPPQIPDEPLMIIHGTDDDIIPYQAVKTLSDNHPNISLVTVGGADHRFKHPGELELIVQKSAEWFLNN